MDLIEVISVNLMKWKVWYSEGNVSNKNENESKSYFIILFIRCKTA